MRPAALLAVAVSAVVGVVCGVGGGLLFDDKGPIVDPLRLGVPLVNQTCTGDTLLMVGWGGRADVAAGVAEDPDHAKYLDTRSSCSTAWVSKGHSSPRYVSYIGPFGTGAQACEKRMTAQYKGDQVISLDTSNTDPLECLCYVPTVFMPLLRSGMDTTPLRGIWINTLQKVLGDLGYLPDHVTGFYDLTTIAAVMQFQHDQGGVSINGVADSTTWGSLVKQGCKLYNP